MGAILSILTKKDGIVMVKLIATAAMSLAALLPSPAQKETVKQPLADDGTVIVKLVPLKAERADGNYIVDDGNLTAQQRYDELKKALDERFSYMFELKAQLDKQQSIMGVKWDEYYKLHEKYNQELKKIIASWVTETDYLA